MLTASTLYNSHRLEIISLSIDSKMDKLWQADGEILYSN